MMDYDTQWQLIYAALIDNGMDPADAATATDKVIANKPSEVFNVETDKEDADASVEGNEAEAAGHILGPETPEHGEATSDSLSPAEEM